jgi:hypothetical protein
VFEANIHRLGRPLARRERQRRDRHLRT